MKTIATLLVGLAVAACATSTEPGTDGLAGSTGNPDRVRVLGAIKGYNSDDPRIEVSAAGRTVRVIVTSYGGGCHSRGDTEVSVSGLTADVTPYDFTAPAGTPCTLPLLSFRHEAEIRFDRGGTALIRVHGIDASTRNAQNMEGTRIVVERQVELR